jgi:hypothetical protein
MLDFGSGQDGIVQHCSSSDVSAVAARRALRLLGDLDLPRLRSR